MTLKEQEQLILYFSPNVPWDPVMSRLWNSLSKKDRNQISDLNKKLRGYGLFFLNRDNHDT